MRNFIIVFFFVFLSCNDNNADNKTVIQKSDMNKVQQHAAVLKLDKLSKEKIKTWSEYESATKNLEQFLSISPNEALNNALTLSEKMKFLKDSIRPKELLNLSFKTRVNVLENETLRLKDMTLITAITAKEVNTQVDKILSALSATNSKINIIYAQLEVEQDIEKIH
ncbi:MAG: hypothetical protein P8H13_08100 [Polaribacter sp.]|nr:hypothetical protein [Polaribacter sp.]MDG1811884.1 hypothetical protein [Polaribacter sp.]MDG1993715.1 hypothetical protein [Polaribacter sp.]